MRRRTFTRSRKPRQPVQWQADPQTYSAPALLAAGIVALQICGSDVASGTNPPVINRFRVERVVGDCYLCPKAAWVAGDVLDFSIGIAEIPVFTTGSANPDPSNPTDADYRWLYLFHWHTVVPGLGNTQWKIETPVEMHIDIKPRLTMRPDRRLLLITQWNPTTMAGTADFAPFLRSLIGRVA